jgi:hypothetical protein
MRALVGCLLVAAACGGGTGPDPSALDAAASVDAASSSDAASSGLTAVWSSNPDVPGMFDNGITVSSAMFAIARLEVVGDAGTPGATTATNLDITWTSTLQPSPVYFGGAPSGLYSQVTLQLDGDLVAPSYVIKGTASINSIEEPFEISDTKNIELDISGYNVALSPGSTATIPIRLDLRGLLDSVNFGALPLEGNVRKLDQSSPQIGDVRDEMTGETFKRN